MIDSVQRLTQIGFHSRVRH